MARDTVRGITGQTYSCPDVAAVDRHITKLCSELDRIPARDADAAYDVHTRRRQVLMDDVDALLDRRFRLLLDDAVKA